MLVVRCLLTIMFTQRSSCIGRPQVEQVDILVSKNQALQILYLKHIKLHKLATMDRNPRKFNPHKRYCRVLLLYYNGKENIPYNWPTEQILTRILSRFLISYALFN